MATTFLKNFVDTCNSRIEEPVRLHLKNVYACLTLSMMAAAAGAYIDFYTQLSNSLLTVLGALGFILAIRFTVDDGKNRQLRLACLLGFSFCTGLGISPLLELVIEIDPSIVVTAFFATSLIFVSFSISAILAKRGSWLFLGGLISSIFFYFVMATLASLFFSSTFLFQLHLYVGLLLMCAFVLYDTQLIMEKRRHGDKDFIAHAMDLFIDFVGIFRRILVIIANKESDRKENKRR